MEESRNLSRMASNTPIAVEHAHVASPVPKRLYALFLVVARWRSLLMEDAVATDTLDTRSLYLLTTHIEK